MKQHKLRKYLDNLAGFFIPVVQVFKTWFRNHAGVLVFLVLPVIYLLNAYGVHHSLGAFYLGSVDPEYFYLYNGVIVSEGNLSIQYFAHPGTPVHFLVAASSRIIELFQPGDYATDVVNDPEKYIHAANLLLNVLVSLVLVFCGVFAKKYSGSYFAALMIQLSPFGSSALLGMSGRLIPEALMMIPLLLTCLMIIKYVFDKNRDKVSVSYLVIFGIIIGFGTACKLSFAPVLLVPLILLKLSARQRIRLVLYSILFFAVFAYPVLFNMNEYWEWVSGMFTHSGKYGGGEKNVIDLSTIPGNLNYLYRYNREFFFIAGVSLLLTGLYSFRPFREKGTSQSRIIRAILAVNMTIIVSIAFTLKHFALYYFMPFSLFKYLLVLLIAMLIIQHQKISLSKAYRAIILSVFSLIILIMTFSQVKEVRASIARSSQRSELLRQEYGKITAMVDKNKPIIMSAPYYGAPFIEFAHYNGFIMSRHLKVFFRQVLKEKYPMSFQYVNWSDKFYFWDDFVDFRQILKKTNTSFYIYTGKDKGNDLEAIENRIWQVLDKNTVTRKVLFQNDDTREQLIEIIVNTGK
ncbi:MAG: hypothetical protein MUC31_07725 [Bacteroidales bacterium]|jgi:hypothetical protein|nr:hypothetical protein [Bacteroidales bacterium]